MIYDITMSKTQFSQLDTLNRITNHLIMSSNSIQDIGLYYGKLGRVSSSTFPKNVVSNALVIVNITL